MLGYRVRYAFDDRLKSSFRLGSLRQPRKACWAERGVLRRGYAFLHEIGGRKGCWRNLQKIIEPILQFMEDHEELEYGVPGPLVHFIEKFYRKGYEAKLMESVKRKPTEHRTCLLNRLINGADDTEKRLMYVTAMKGISENPKARPSTVERAKHFMKRQGI